MSIGTLCLPEGLNSDLERIADEKESTRVIILRDALGFFRDYAEDANAGYVYWHEKPNEPESRLPLFPWPYRYGRKADKKFSITNRQLVTQVKELAEHYKVTQTQLIRDALDLFVQHIDRVREGYELYKLKKGEDISRKRSIVVYTTTGIY